MVIVFEAGLGEDLSEKPVRLVASIFLVVTAVPQLFVFVSDKLYVPGSIKKRTLIGLPEKPIGKLSVPGGGVNVQV